MSVTGEPGRPPAKAGIPLTDLGAALFAVTGILAALHHRARAGVGQYIDTSLVEAGIALSVWEATEYFSGPGVPAPLGSAHRMNAPYQAMRCADGYVTIGANTNRLFQRLCGVLGHPEWNEEPEFANNPSRVRNRAKLATLIEHVMVEATLPPLAGAARRRRHSLWTDQRLRAGVCRSAGHGAWHGARYDHPVLGRLRTLGSPIRMSATPADAGRRAPLLAEHTDEVLGEARTQCR